MLTGEGRWSLGVLIGLPIIAIFLCILVTIVIVSLIWEKRDRYADGAGFVSAGIAGVIALIVIGFSVFGYFPYKEHYHKWMTVQGTVETKNVRMITNSDGFSERLVIKFKESPTLYGCDDTRCTLAEVGKRIELACKKEYQYGSQPGWACRYGRSG